MICKGCTQQFSHDLKSKRLPRIIVSCGHTVCQTCLQTKIKDQGACPECSVPILKDGKKITPKKAEIMVQASFPINKALIQMSRQFQLLDQQSPIHPLRQKSPLIEQDGSYNRKSRAESFENVRTSSNEMTNNNQISDFFGSLFGWNQQIKNFKTGYQDQDISVDSRTAYKSQIKEQIQVEAEIQTKRKMMLTQKSWVESESEFEMGSLGAEGISSPRRSDKKCRAHEHKKIEAFCENCKQLLCIQCILKQDHKSHEMVSLDVGSLREKQAFDNGMQGLDELESELQNQIFRIKGHLNSLDEYTVDQRQKLSKIFNEIRQKINEREEFVKQGIADHLEQEQTLYKSRIKNLQDQIKCIQEVAAERDKMQKEKNIMLLQKTRMRQKLLLEASKPIDQKEVKITLPPIRKEEELTQLVSVIIPKKMKAQIMSGSVFVGRKQSINSKLGYLGLKKTATSSMTRHMNVVENHVALDRTLQNDGLRSKGFNNRRFSKEKQSIEENKNQLRSVQQENKMRFSPTPATQKENMVENERVDTFWSSKNNTKEHLEPRKMKPKDIQERLSHKLQKRSITQTDAVNLGKTNKARNSSRLKGLINRMNSQTDIHSNSQIETKSIAPLTHRGAHNEYNQIGNGLLGNTNDAIGSINKKPSKMLQESVILNTKSDMISQNDSLGFNNLMQNIQHITLENNVSGIKDDNSMVKKNFALGLKKKDESQLDLFEVPEVNRTARGNKKFSNQPSKQQVFSQDLSNNSRYGHALRKNFMKSKKQNLKDFVHTSDKQQHDLGSARTKVIDTSKDQKDKDKQQLAPNKKKKKNKIYGSKNMHAVKKQEFSDLSKLLSIQNDVSMLQKYTKDDMNDISLAQINKKLTKSLKSPRSPLRSPTILSQSSSKERPLASSRVKLDNSPEVDMKCYAESKKSASKERRKTWGNVNPQLSNRTLNKDTEVPAAQSYQKVQLPGTNSLEKDLFAPQPVTYNSTQKASTSSNQLHKQVRKNWEHKEGSLIQDLSKKTTVPLKNINLKEDNPGLQRGMIDTEVATPKENIINTTLDNQGSIQDTYYKKENSPIGDHASDQFMSKVNFSMMKKQNSGLEQTPIKPETPNSKKSLSSKSKKQRLLRSRSKSGSKRKQWKQNLALTSQANSFAKKLGLSELNPLAKQTSFKAIINTSDRNNSLNSDLIGFSKTSEEKLQSPYQYILKGRLANKKLSSSSQAKIRGTKKLSISPSKLRSMVQAGPNPRTGGLMRFKQKSLPKYNRFLLPEEDSLGQIQITTENKDEYSTVGAREAYNNNVSGGAILINDQQSPLTPNKKYTNKSSITMMMPSTQKKFMSKKIGGIVINNATEMLDQSSEEEEEDNSMDSSQDSCDFAVDEIEDKQTEKNMIQIHQSRYSGANKNANLSMIQKNKNSQGAYFSKQQIQAKQIIEFNTSEIYHDDNIPLEIHHMKEIQTSNSFKNISQNNGPYSNRSIGKPLFPRAKENSPNSVKTLKSASEKSPKMKTYSQALQKDTSYEKFTPSNSMKSKINPMTKTEAVTTPIQDYNVKSKKLLETFQDDNETSAFAISEAIKAVTLQNHLVANNYFKKSAEVDPNVTQTKSEFKSFVSNNSMVSSKVNCSILSGEMSKVKDEFIFVFGGQTQSNYLEVFDVQREICRSFDVYQNYSRGGDEQIKTRGYRTMCFQRSHEAKCIKEKVYLVGGEDQEGNTSRLVRELNINDLQIFQSSDFKLPQPLSNFMIGFNSQNLDYVIAGGIDENKSLSKKMYRIFVQDINENIFQTTKQAPIILGRYENLQFCAEELPDMIATRQDSSLTVRPTSQGNYQIYIIGGVSSQKAPFIDVFDSETYEWHSFHPNLQDLNFTQISGHQSVMLPDNNIYIIGGDTAQDGSGPSNGLLKQVHPKFLILNIFNFIDLIQIIILCPFWYQ